MWFALHLSDFENQILSRAGLFQHAREVSDFSLVASSCWKILFPVLCTTPFSSLMPCSASLCRSVRTPLFHCTTHPQHSTLISCSTSLVSIPLSLSKTVDNWLIVFVVYIPCPPLKLLELLKQCLCYAFNTYLVEWRKGVCILNIWRKMKI